MAGKYEGLAKVIVQNVGGRMNIENITVSGNTLKFGLKDFGRANTDILKETDGISAVDNSGKFYEVSVKRDPAEVYAAVAERAGLAVEGVDSSTSSGGGAMRMVLSFVLSFIVSFAVVMLLDTLFLGNGIDMTRRLVIAGGAALIAVIIVALFNRPKDDEPQQPSINMADEDVPASVQPEKLGAPVAGIARELSEINDEAFGSYALGKGVYFEPRIGKLYAPCDGILTTFFDTGHALAIRSDKGAEVLIHVGLNTVQMKGDGFESNRKQGDYVKRGELVLTFDLEKIKAAGYDPATPMVVTNTESYDSVDLKKTGEVQPGENVIELK